MQTGAGIGGRPLHNVGREERRHEIQKACHRLAKKLHPDLNPGNQTAEDKFKGVSAAYDLLSDRTSGRGLTAGKSTLQARSRRSGNITGILPIRVAGRPTPASRAFRFRRRRSGGYSLGDLRSRGPRWPPQAGLGCPLSSRSRFLMPSVGDAPPGDALIEVSMLPHPYFTRKGDDIYLDLPISLKEAVLATRIQVPTRAVRSRWLYQNGQTPVAFSG
jgi:curved DNA-binding protein CbpA